MRALVHRSTGRFHLNILNAKYFEGVNKRFGSPVSLAAALVGDANLCRPARLTQGMRKGEKRKRTFAGTMELRLPQAENAREQLSSPPVEDA